MGRLAANPPASTEDPRDQIDSMLVALQGARVEFVGVIMQLRYLPPAGHHRAIRKAVIAFLRVQRLSEDAARLLDATGTSIRSK